MVFQVFVIQADPASWKETAEWQPPEWDGRGRRQGSLCPLGSQREETALVLLGGALGQGLSVVVSEADLMTGVGQASEAGEMVTGTQNARSLPLEITRPVKS